MRYFVQKKQKNKTCPVKNKTQEALWFVFQEPRWWENNDERNFLHTAPEKLRRDCIFFPVRRKHLNYTLTVEKREDDWPERSVHVSPDKVGSYPLRSQGGPTPVGVGPPLQPQAGKCRNLALLFF